VHVLVAGGAGYIGSQTAKALAASGFTPVVLDNLSTGHRSSVRWGPFVSGNIADTDLVRQTILDFNIETAIHFAASAYVGESVRMPRAYFRNNITNSLAFLDSLLDTGLRKIVFSSSCATYGIPSSLPIDETTNQRPVNPYGESKLFIERALDAYDVAYGLHSVSLRYFNAAGADPDGELGESHDPETHLIPIVIDAALGNRPYVDIFGVDYPTSDGTAIRDYVHVADLADAHVRALRYLLGDGQTVALNLGTAMGHSVREVIAAVESASGRPVPLREMPRRAGDPPALIADARRAREFLGWEPGHSALEQIVRGAWKWHARQSANREHPAANANAQLEVVG
jgi:UDP-glucose-4-epimerase GalE